MYLCVPFRAGAFAAAHLALLVLYVPIPSSSAFLATAASLLHSSTVSYQFSNRPLEFRKFLFTQYCTTQGKTLTLTLSQTKAAWPYIYRTHASPSMAPNLDSYFKSVDSSADSFVDRLRQAVAIPSISADEERRQDVVKMGMFLKSQLEGLGAHMEARPLGKQPGKEHLELPPAIVGRYPAKKDESKKTILVYGHYDVQPAELSDGWNTEPFKLTEDAKGRMYGRGSTDDKGPVLGWVNVIEAHKKAGVEFPVNLLMCFEGMEEYGSEGLDDFIMAECKPGKFFADADACCISDNYWLGTEKPCLTYGLRGCSYYSIEISGPG
ncbi:CNDP dipeptidase, partial [Hortaea werneckii]